MSSAKEVLEFDFNARTFVAQAPKGLKVPAGRLATLRKIASEQQSRGIDMPDSESLREVHQLYLKTPPDKLTTVFGSPRRIRQLAWALTYSEGRAACIVESQMRLRIALKLMEKYFRSGVLFGVFDALMETWDTSNAGLLRAFLKEHLMDYNGSRKFIQKLKDNMKWYCEEDGATQLAMFLVSEKKKLSEVWEYLELPDYMHSYSYFGAVAAAYTTSNNRVNQDYVEDVVDFVRKYDNDKASRAILSKLIERLGVTASEALRAPVQSYALQEWQDPRVVGADVRWRDISDEARKIFTHWITTEDLHFFFDVVAKACNDKKFAYRRDFWLSYLKHIAFCRPVLRKDSEYLFSNDPQVLQYYRDRRPAELKGGNKDQHAFIIQMGAFTFVEFSTAGACYVYRSKNLPFKLGESEYYMDELRSQRLAVHRVIHSSSETHRWQHQFIDWLNKNWTSS